MIVAFLFGAFVVLLLITGFDTSAWIAAVFGLRQGLASLLLQESVEPTKKPNG